HGRGGGGDAADRPDDLRRHHRGRPSPGRARRRHRARARLRGGGRGRARADRPGDAGHQGQRPGHRRGRGRLPDRRDRADGWDLAAWTLEYAPVGGGSYHWVATGGAPGERRFVTVDDLDDKGSLGRTRPAVLAGLRAAMDAAVTLRRQAGLGFVVDPVPAITGETVRPAGDRHAVAVFPFLTGTPFGWGEP